MSSDALTPSSAPSARAALVDRRRALSIIGLGLVAAACSSSASDTAADTTATDTAAATADTTAAAADTTAPAADTTAAAADTTAAAVATDGTPTPEETGGPFPSDGTNDNGDGEVSNVLGDTRSVRSDITTDLDGSNAQEGVPFTLTTTVVDSSGTALAGAAVYIWHCNKDGGYSAYDSSMLGGDFSDRSYLRGVQITGADGSATFTSILPGRYQGRAFHIHFEVFSDASYSEKLLTSQMAIDDDLIASLYADAGYDDALSNETLNGNDNVFADGVEHQLLTVSGEVASGLVATFTAVV